jgi:hypothetical protein
MHKTSNFLKLKLVFTQSRLGVSPVRLTNNAKTLFLVNWRQNPFRGATFINQ